MIFESDLVTRYNYDLINLILSPLIKLEQTRRRRRGRRRKEKEKEYLVINVSVQEHVIFYLDLRYDTICKSHRLLNLLTGGSPSSGSSFSRSLPSRPIMERAD